MLLSFIKHFFIQNKNKKRDCLLASSISKTALIIHFRCFNGKKGYKCVNYFDSHCLIKLITFRRKPLSVSVISWISQTLVFRN